MTAKRTSEKTGIQKKKGSASSARKNAGSAKGPAKKQAAAKKPPRTGAPKAEKKPARSVKEAVPDRPARKPAKAKTTRSTLDLRAFRERLLAKQAELLQAYNSVKGDTRTRQNDGSEDYIDYAVSSYDREFLLSLTELEKNQLLLVEEALLRIARGEFGACSQCGKPIPPKRLEVQPWASYCLACQELVDQGVASDGVEDLSDEDEEADVSVDDAEEDAEEDIEADEAIV
jgi:DnaK suppressor protein